MKQLAAYIFYILICFGFQEGFSQNPEVNTTSGVVRGITLPESHAFYGVRYAQAPIGDLRFRPPVPASYSEEKLDVSVQNFPRCYEYPLDCISPEVCNKNYSEDCLFLDINVPSRVSLPPSRSDLLPVLFWIHGGGFSFSSGTELLYDGRQLANETNTIVVAINYRLGALGGLVFEGDGESINGNQALKDQRLALQWVNDNIGSFGGDRNQITIFGESAGGQSVVMHLQSSISRPLFKHAIIQSFPASVTFQNKTQAMLKTDTLLSLLSCTGNQLQCLRNASAFQIMSAQFAVIINAAESFLGASQPYRPILDGVEFTQNPFEFFESTSLSSDRRIIIGTTADELAPIKLVFANTTVTRQLFIEQNIFYAGPVYGPLAAQEYLRYAGNPDDPNYDYTDVLAQEIADLAYVCPNRALARLLVSSIGAETLPVYHYVFDYPVNATNCVELVGGAVAALFCNFAYHAVDLPYVFNSERISGLQLTADARSVADMMAGFWGEFAYTGKPASSNTWPSYEEAITTDSATFQWPTLRITAPESALIQNYRSTACDFWDNLGIYVNLTTPTQATTQSTTSGISPLRFDVFLIVMLCFICCILLHW